MSRARNALVRVRVEVEVEELVGSWEEGFINVTFTRVFYITQLFRLIKANSGALRMSASMPSAVPAPSNAACIAALLVSVCVHCCTHKVNVNP